MVFAGRLCGVAHLLSGEGRTRVQVHTTRGTLPEGCVAWLCADTLSPLPLANGAGEADGAVACCGLILERGGEILGTGGFAGRDAARREAELRVRLRTQPQQSRPTIAFTPPPAPAPPKPQPSPAPAPQARPRPPEQKPSAHSSQALQGILRMAELLFPPQQPQTAEAQTAPPPFVPFPDAYPGVAFNKLSYPGSGRFYLEAQTQNGAERYTLHAIQGDYSPVPPVPGFTRFLRTRDGTGYWVRARPSRE